MQMGQQDVEAARLGVRAPHTAHARAGVEDHDRAVTALDLGTGSVAAVLDRLGSGAGDRATRTPQANAHQPWSLVKAASCAPRTWRRRRSGGRRRRATGTP